MYQHPAPAHRRSTIWGTAVRTLEPDAKRPHHIVVGYIAFERAEHLQSRQRRRLRDVPPLEGLKGQGQRVREHNKVNNN